MLSVLKIRLETKQIDGFYEVKLIKGDKGPVRLLSCIYEHDENYVTRILTTVLKRNKCFYRNDVFMIPTTVMLGYEDSLLTFVSMIFNEVLESLE